MVGLDVLLILLFILILAYFEAAALISVSVIAIVLFSLSFISISEHFFTFTVLWLVFLVSACFMLSSRIRRRFITNYLVKRFEGSLPTISETERIAIEAGDIWWEKELFSGRPSWKKLFAIPEKDLTSAEKTFLDSQVNEFCNMLDDSLIVEKPHDLPSTAWDFIKKEKFLGIIIPKEHGGLGFSATAHSAIIARIATKSVSAAITIMVPNSLGPAELLLHYGTDEQKSFYLPRLARGVEIPCFALTAPEAGSDAGSIPDTGIICRGKFEGREIIGIKLNWDKRYITLAPIATVIGVAMRLFDPEQLLGKKQDLGITLCLIPASHPGVKNGIRHNPLHLGFMNGPTRGENVFIPQDWIIGGNSMIGSGWKMLMESLSAGRGISLPALSAASGQMTYRLTGGYARVRRQFNMSISSFEGVAESLGYISGFNYMLESCRRLTISAVDQGIRPALSSAISKYHMTELARKVITHAMDVHAGHGIQLGPKNFIGSAHIAIPVSITVEGANILTRNLIIFGQGAIRCHPFVLAEIEQFSLKPSCERSIKLDKLLFSHIGRVVSLVIRNFWFGITGGRLIFSRYKDKTARYQRQLTRMSAAFALFADATLILLGGTLKRKERISARLGDILSHLYLGSAVLKYFHANKQPATDKIYLNWCLSYSLASIQQTIDELVQNYPSKFLGKVIRWLIFPFGRVYKMPPDKLHSLLVDSMIQPSGLRDRLTHLCYKNESLFSSSEQIDKALDQLPSVEPLFKRMHSALRNGEIDSSKSYEYQLQQAVKKNIVNATEAKKLREYNALYQNIIMVDEFSHDFERVLTKDQFSLKEEVV